jgi:hypothetical protein
MSTQSQSPGPSVSSGANTPDGLIQSFTTEQLTTEEKFRRLRQALTNEEILLLAASLTSDNKQIQDDADRVEAKATYIRAMRDDIRRRIDADAGESTDDVVRLYTSVEQVENVILAIEQRSTSGKELGPLKPLILDLFKDLAVLTTENADLNKRLKIFEVVEEHHRDMMDKTAASDAHNDSSPSSLHSSDSYLGATKKDESTMQEKLIFFKNQCIVLQKNDEILRRQTSDEIISTVSKLSLLQAQYDESSHAFTELQAVCCQKDSLIADAVSAKYAHEIEISQLTADVEQLEQYTYVLEHRLSPTFLNSRHLPSAPQEPGPVPVEETKDCDQGQYDYPSQPHMDDEVSMISTQKSMHPDTVTSVHDVASVFAQKMAETLATATASNQSNQSTKVVQLLKSWLPSHDNKPYLNKNNVDFQTFTSELRNHAREHTSHPYYNVLTQAPGYATVDECACKGISLQTLTLIQRQWRGAIHGVCSKDNQDRFDIDVPEDALWQGSLVYRILALKDVGSRKAAEQSKSIFDKHAMNASEDIDSWLTLDGVMYSRMIADEPENSMSDRALINRLVEKMPTDSEQWRFMANNIKIQIGDKNGICKNYSGLLDWLRMKCNQGMITDQSKTKSNVVDHTLVHSALVQRISQGEHLSKNCIRRALDKTSLSGKKKTEMMNALISSVTTQHSNPPNANPYRENTHRYRMYNLNPSQTKTCTNPQCPQENNWTHATHTCMAPGGARHDPVKHAAWLQSKKDRSPYSRHNVNIATVSADSDNSVHYDFESSSAD